MKKLLLIALCISIMTIGANANATIVTDSKALDAVLDRNQTSYSWTHVTPIDFEVPYDVVNSATLDISAFSSNGQSNVFVENHFLGTLVSGSWSWTTLDVADFFVHWDNGQLLDVTVTSPRDPYLYLINSTLTLDYTNYDAPGTTPIAPNDVPIPNPEPGTLMLLGSGLSGLAFWGKRRKVSVA